MLTDPLAVSYGDAGQHRPLRRAAVIRPSLRRHKSPAHFLTYGAPPKSGRTKTQVTPRTCRPSRAKASRIQELRGLPPPPSKCRPKMSAAYVAVLPHPTAPRGERTLAQKPEPAMPTASQITQSLAALSSGAALAAHPSAWVVVVVGVVAVVGLVVKYGIPALFPESSGGLSGLVDARTRARSTERHWDNVARLTELAHPDAPAPTTNSQESNGSRRWLGGRRRRHGSLPPAPTHRHAERPGAPRNPPASPSPPQPPPHTRGARAAGHTARDQHGRGCGGGRGGGRGRVRGRVR